MMDARQLVTLPYNLLLLKRSREALEIDLTDQIVVVDEAHSKLSYTQFIFVLLGAKSTPKILSTPFCPSILSLSPVHSFAPRSHS